MKKWTYENNKKDKDELKQIPEHKGVRQEERVEQAKRRRQKREKQIKKKQEKQSHQE